MTGQVLSSEEIKKIHEGSIRLLRETGIKFPGERAMDILEAGGARVDRDKETAYISEDMVKKALKTAPKKFTLGARNSAFDLEMPSASSSYNLDGTGVSVLEYDSGSKHAAGVKDIADAAVVFDDIDIGTVLWLPAAAQDVPGGARGIVGTGTAFMNCRKHFQDEVKNIREVRYVMEMAKAILGSEEEVRRRKIYSVTYCTVAPLSHDREMMEATMELTKYEAPVLIYPMPACGTTGPASLYSNIVMANAEALSALVLFQLTTPGTPLIFGAALGIVNMRSGIFLEGAPETSVQLMAMTEMGKYYGLPTIVAGCLTDAKVPGMQAVLEKFLTSMPLVLAGVDVVQGIGLLESSMTLSLEQMLIDEEIGRLCRRLAQGVDASPDKELFDDIAAVGQEGHFLKQKSTRKLFRTDEFYLPGSLIDRGSYDEWTNMGSPDMFSKAHERVSAILKEGPKEPLDSGAEKTIKEIMDEAVAKL